MSDISSISSSQAAAVGRTQPITRSTPPATGSPSRGRDEVELSTTAQFLSKIAELPDVRSDLVDRVRGEIEAGTYESDDKLDAAIDALFAEEFGG